MKAISGSLLPVTVVALCAVCGCRSTRVNTVEPASTSAQVEMISDQRVLTDQSLNNKVTIVGLNTATGPEGFLRIQAQVLNRTRRMAKFTYRVEWFDEQGMLIQLPSAVSIPRSIESRQTAFISATAPTTRAKDFRISFLEPTN